MTVKNGFCSSLFNKHMNMKIAKLMSKPVQCAHVPCLTCRQDIRRQVASITSLHSSPKP